MTLVAPGGFVTAQDLDRLTLARWGIYAKNGRGKTTFAATVPATPQAPCLYVSVDVENIRPILPRIKDGSFKLFKLNRWNDLQTVLGVLDHPKSPFKYVTFDTWSRVQDLAMGKVMNYEPAAAGTEKDYIDRIGKRPKDWNGWGQVGDLVSEWMHYFNRRPVHVLYLIQEADREQKYDEQFETGPRLTPAAALPIRDDLEILGRLYVEIDGKADEGSRPEDEKEVVLNLEPEDKFRKAIDPDAREVRKLFIGSHERYFAKGPTHVLGRVVENPTWGKLAVVLG